jgi:hydroxymethylglutaryl-CoA synthase
MMDTAIGIEALYVHVPEHFLDLRSLAEASGVDPAKYLIGLGGKRMSVPAPFEDAVTMAVSAAMGLFERYEVNPEQIGMVIVGSESEVDSAKATAAYVHGMLGLPPHCRTYDVKHACYSATAGLRAAADWCRNAQSGAPRKALVIASDIARYDVGSPGEPTQGAGAVAMLVGNEPGVLALDSYPEALFTEDVMDFWRPVYRTSAVVDGKTSIHSYLKALSHTFTEYEKVSGLGFNDFDYLLFHVPFPKMAFKAFSLLHDRQIARREGARALASDFNTRAEPALFANREIGNIYSGSLYLSLAGLLHRHPNDAKGKKISLFSYGSGCCAELFSGRVGESADAWRGKTGIATGLERRTELTYSDYLKLRKTGEALATNSAYRLLDPDCRNSRATFLGIRNHKRVYTVPSREAPQAQKKQEGLG